jgi:quinol monooxygenase YgiN
MPRPALERNPMITKALLFRMESQTDEDTMDTFLEDLSAEISWEKTTQAWFGIRYMRGEFGVFVCFHDEAGREAHLAAASATKFFAAEHRLMTAPPRTAKLDVLACKMPPVLENVTKGLVLRFKAKAGKEAEVAQFLRDAKAYADKETGTLAWFAIQYDESHFGIFDVFADNGARFAHLTGHIPRELAKNAFTLLGGMPEMHLVDVMAGTARQEA